MRLWMILCLNFLMSQKYNNVLRYYIGFLGFAANLLKAYRFYNVKNCRKYSTKFLKCHRKDIIARYTMFNKEISSALALKIKRKFERMKNYDEDD